MKKLLLMAASVAVLATACKKENAAPVSNPANAGRSNSEQITNRYAKEVRVYDETKEFYADLKIESANKVEVEQYYNNALNMKLELINDEFVPTEKNTAKKSEAPVIKPDLDKVLSIKFVKVNKGSYKGFKLKNTMSSKANEWVHTSFGNSTVYFLPDECSVYVVTNYQVLHYPLGSYDLYCEDFYYNGSSWILVNTQTIEPENNYYFGGVGYSSRYCYLRCPQGVNADVTIWS